MVKISTQKHTKKLLLIFLISCILFAIFRVIKEMYNMYYRNSKFKGEFIPRIDYETTIIQRNTDVMKTKSPLEIDDTEIMNPRKLTSNVLNEKPPLEL